MAKIKVLSDPDFKPLEFDGFRKSDPEFEGNRLVEFDQFGLTCEG